MSRSRRRPYFWCFGGSSNNLWLRKANRRYRRAVKQLLIINKVKEDTIFPYFDEYANPWDSPRDASHPYYNPEYPECKRK